MIYTNYLINYLTNDCRILTQNFQEHRYKKRFHTLTNHTKLCCRKYLQRNPTVFICTYTPVSPQKPGCTGE